MKGTITLVEGNHVIAYGETLDSYISEEEYGVKLVKNLGGNGSINTIYPWHTIKEVVKDYTD